eukprot:1893511-Heterocapsa_arctica.AAC.1
MLYSSGIDYRRDLRPVGHRGCLRDHHDLLVARVVVVVVVVVRVLEQAELIIALPASLRH